MSEVLEHKPLLETYKKLLAGKPDAKALAKMASELVDDRQLEIFLIFLTEGKQSGLEFQDIPKVKNIKLGAAISTCRDVLSKVTDYLSLSVTNDNFSDVVSEHEKRLAAFEKRFSCQKPFAKAKAPSKPEPILTADHPLRDISYCVPKQGKARKLFEALPTIEGMTPVVAGAFARACLFGPEYRLSLKDSIGAAEMVADVQQATSLISRSPVAHLLQTLD